MDSSTTLYDDALGVAPDLDEVALRRAFRRLVHRLHPDTGGIHSDPVRLQAVVEAYRALTTAHRGAEPDEAPGFAPDGGLTPSVTALLTMAEHHLLRGQPGRARAQVLRALELSPGDTDGLELLRECEAAGSFQPVAADRAWPRSVRAHVGWLPPVALITGALLLAHWLARFAG